jgi:hypothetical protein
MRTNSTLRKRCFQFKMDATLNILTGAPFMKTCLTILAIALFLTVLNASQVQAADVGGHLRHVVCLKFKDGTKPEEIRKVEEAFRDLKNKISTVISLEWGTNTSLEKRDKGFTHCFFLTFVDEKDLKVYINHPDHKEFGKLLGPVIDDVFVIDYHARE